MKFLRSLYVYWPVLLFASTAVVGWVYEPAQVELLFPLSWSFERVCASLSSPAFWTFLVLSVLGIVVVDSLSAHRTHVDGPIPRY